MASLSNHLPEPAEGRERATESQRAGEPAEESIQPETELLDALLSI